ncbi:putative ribosomally synthesized peptide with SipW-like signal peptide [Labedella gwakjiensis]|uniref:Acyl-CoA dehydrogenase n=1 Tax=Labedella gwakjiensis TaxID=390269 RepID=A0A2P8GUM3_9MICO|nr:SipW-dependent-type signal peptide-containing protein [Labedella gwakjiensis]PSL37660.1 putative ribosomally synthesized peptide with SipW-like signal peptide [Labedella gwakjiensis]RUQ87745.1 acyl-CoA dehydrogenase [Labedella gwakjiensis]
MTRTRSAASSRRTKTYAILAGGTLVGVAVTATLAAWTDTEWVFGGNGAGGPGVGTSTFEVEQNTVAPFAAGTFTNEEENPGGEITFGLDALALSPGDSVYAAVALRTAPESVEGEVLLQPAVPADGIATDDADGYLFDALDVRVATDDAAFDCDVDAFTGAPGAPAVIADGTLGATGATAEQALLADAGSVQYYCFEVTLPEDPTLPAGATLDDLMGLTVAPAWEFEAESF